MPARLVDARRRSVELAASSATDSRAEGEKGGRIPGNKVDPVRRLLQRATLGWTLAEQEEVERWGADAWLERQLDPESIDDLGLGQALDEALPSSTMTPWERLLAYDGNEVRLFLELLVDRLYRGVYSPRQLFERMVIFWTDHFNIDIASDFAVDFVPSDQREVIRPHALGKFPDMLRASARSAAMASYLDNDSNVAGHPNENYARELMELHTLGVDGGYTEEDVREVARCFTGWTYHSYEAGELFGRFVFVPELHDPGPKRVLGVSIAAGGGLSDGETVLALLAEHPSTARFLATKMLRYLWGYRPDEAAVAAVAAVYLATGGDIAAMVRECLRPERMVTATTKLKRPYHLVVSALRALFVGIDDPYPLIAVLLQAGHLPFTWPPPNGFPDAESYWSGLLLPRFGFASSLASPTSLGLTMDLPFLDPAAYPLELVPTISTRLLGLLLAPDGLPLPARADVEGFLRAEPVLDRAAVARALGLVVASPTFQRY